MPKKATHNTKKPLASTPQLNFVPIENVLTEVDLDFFSEKKSLKKKLPYKDEEGETTILVDNYLKVKKNLEENGIDDQFTIIVSAKDTLQIDIDRKEDFDTFKNNIGMLLDIDLIASAYYTVSKSGRMHITVNMNKKLADNARIALQAILGSDLVRELMNFKNSYKKQFNPILFIESNDALENKKYIDLSKLPKKTNHSADESVPLEEFDV